MNQLAKAPSGGTSNSRLFPVDFLNSIYCHAHSYRVASLGSANRPQGRFLIGLFLQCEVSKNIPPSTSLMLLHYKRSVVPALHPKNYIRRAAKKVCCSCVGKMCTIPWLQIANHILGVITPMSHSEEVPFSQFPLTAAGGTFPSKGNPIPVDENTCTVHPKLCGWRQISISSNNAYDQ